MRVLVVGSVRGAKTEAEEAQIRKAGEEVGKVLAERGHTALVGSEDPVDVDPNVVAGALSAPNAKPVEVHLMQGGPGVLPWAEPDGQSEELPASVQ